MIDGRGIREEMAVTGQHPNKHGKDGSEQCGGNGLI